MAWIESNEELANHPKTKRAARILDISIPAMLGHLHLLWYWCLNYAQDGDLSRFDIEDISDACMWTDDAQAFIDALIECGPGESAGFLERAEDSSLVVHDWMDYAGRLIEKREENAERMRKKRAEKQRATHVQRTFTARAGATVPNPTVPNQTINTTTANTAEFLDEPAQDEVKPESAITYYEKTMGRGISGPECETIQKNLSDFEELGCRDPDAMVIAAIKKADLMGKRSMRYIDKILLDWQKKKILTIQEIQAEDEQFQVEKGKNKASPKKKSSKYDDIYL